MATSRNRGSVSLGSQEYYDYFCQPCGKEGNHLEAEGYCTDCQEFLCRGCCKIHSKPTALHHHVLLDKQHMKKYGPPTVAQNKPVDQCDQHQGKLIEYFCTVHKELACTACLMLNHRTCDPVLFIPDESANIRDSQEYKDLIQTLCGMENQTAYMNAKFQRKAASTDDTYTSAMQEFDQFRKEVNDAMDDCKKELTEMAENIRGADKDRMKSRTGTTASTAKDIQIFHSEFEHLETTNKFSRLFIVTKKAGEKIRNLQTTLDGLETDSNVTQYTFIPNQQIKQLLQSSEGIGTLRQDSDFTNQNQHSNAAGARKKDIFTVKRGTKQTSNFGTDKGFHGAQVEDPFKGDPKKIVASHVEDIHVPGTGSYKPLITGITIVGDTLVICDNNTCRVVLHSLKTKLFLDEMYIGDDPWDVTEVDQQRGQVVVTIPDAKKLLFLKVTDKLSKVREINFKSCCYGVASIGDQLAVTFTNPSKVELFDLNGKVLHGSHRIVDTMFAEPKYVAFGSGGHTLYISDMGKHCIIRAAINGTSTGAHADRNLRGPHQLALDSNGNIFICARWSETLNLFGPDLKKVKVILDHADGISCPRALFLCPLINKLFVGVGNGIIKVFKLS